MNPGNDQLGNDQIESDEASVGYRIRNHRLITENEEQALQRVDKLANVLDDAIAIPGTRWRMGLDSILGLIPVAGDIAGAGITLYLVGTAAQVGAPKHLIVRMLSNAGIDLAVGVVPVLGDVLDVAWRANRRNANLLRNHLKAQQIREEIVTLKSKLAGWGVVLIGVLMLSALGWGLWRGLMWLAHAG